jgi:DNA invertase Pin-like site-specific DNA recombinase
MREFTDVDLSASSFATKERPGWLALRRMIEAGFVQGVVVWAVNRASREVEDWSGFLNLCRRHQVLIHVITHDRTYDCSNPHDIKSLLNEGIDGWYESERRSIDVKRGVNGAKAEGRPLSGLAIGYRKVYDGPRLVNLEEEPQGAAKIRTVFEMLDNGHSVTAVSRATGFSQQQVRASARRMTYIAKRRLADGTLVDCTWPPLVDADQFWRVQSVLDSHRFAGQRWGAHKYLLSFIATCGGCGGPVTTGKQRGERIYRCAPKGHVVIGVERADNAVMFALLGHLIEPGVLERYLPSPDTDAAAKAEADAARLRAELNDWLEAGVSPQAYKRKEDELTPKISAAEERARKARATATPATAALAEFERALDPVTGDETLIASDARLNKAIEVWNDLPALAARDLVKQTLHVVMYPVRKARTMTGLYGAEPPSIAQIGITWRDTADNGLAEAEES